VAQSLTLPRPDSSGRALLLAPIRMQMRRMTRLTNAFSKKWENLWAAYCVHFAWYNFIRRHQTLRMTPAVAAGITDHMRTVRELLEGCATRSGQLVPAVLPVVVKESTVATTSKRDHGVGAADGPEHA